VLELITDERHANNVPSSFGLLGKYAWAFAQRHAESLYQLLRTLLSDRRAMWIKHKRRYAYESRSGLKCAIAKEDFTRLRIGETPLSFVNG